MRSRDSQTYLRARENLSRHDGRYLQNAPAIDNDRRHARRSCYIEFLSCSARIAGSIWFPNGRIRANFLCARCTEPVHANWVNKFNLAPFTDVCFESCRGKSKLVSHYKYIKFNYASRSLILFRCLQQGRKVTSDESPLLLFFYNNALVVTSYNFS